jgi:hypothetical protein
MPAGWRRVIAGGDLRRIDAPRQHRLDGAMNEQVRIAPDRRGEVRVGLVAEPEVANVVRAVNSLLHRAQQYGLQQLLIRAADNACEQIGVIGRAWLIAAAQSQAERLEKRMHVGQPVRRRPLVHPVQHRMTIARQQVGRADVGRQHALLDQLVRVVAGARHDLLDPAIGVADDVGLGGLQVERAALDARLRQHLVQRVQVPQVCAQRREPVRGGAVGQRQRIPNLGVGQACV